MLLVRNKEKYPFLNKAYFHISLEGNIELIHENLPQHFVSFMDDEKIRIFKNTQYKKIVFALCFLFNHSSLRFTWDMSTLMAGCWLCLNFIITVT
jgi:Na+/alanine symporter